MAQHRFNIRLQEPSIGALTALWEKTCITCGGSGASLPSDCPGQRMSAVERQSVAAHGLNFRGGRWLVLRRGAEVPVQRAA
jgi:hypothetical protein